MKLNKVNFNLDDLFEPRYMGYLDSIMVKLKGIQGTMTFWRKKEFKTLQKEWYDKLKGKGFGDIESTNPDEQDSRYLKDHSLIMNRRYSPDVEEHYRRCRIHYNDHTFKSDLDQDMWGWYSEGQSYRKIIKLIQEHHGIKRSVFYVFTHVKRMLKEMEELKLWEKE